MNSNDDGRDVRDGAVPLLGLELTGVENKEQSSADIENSNASSAIFPLLGTKSLKSLSKSSERRSTQRVCYDSLLRFGVHSQDLTSRKTVRNGPRGCYGSILSSARTTFSDKSWNRMASATVTSCW